MRGGPTAGSSSSNAAHGNRGGGEVRQSAERLSRERGEQTHEPDPEGQLRDNIADWQSLRAAENAANTSSAPIIHEVPSAATIMKQQIRSDNFIAHTKNSKYVHAHQIDKAIIEARASDMLRTPDACDLFSLSEMPGKLFIHRL